MPVAAVALGCGTALTSALIGGVAVVLRSGSRVTCACFGASSGRPIGGAHLAWNAGISALLLSGLIGSGFGQGRASAGAVIVALAAGGLAGLLLIRFDDMAGLPAMLAGDARVPAGKLVVLGDNPESSMDSRSLGYVPGDRLLGVVTRPLVLPGPAGLTRETGQPVTVTPLSFGTEKTHDERQWLAPVGRRHLSAGGMNRAPDLL